MMINPGIPALIYCGIPARFPAHRLGFHVPDWNSIGAAPNVSDTAASRLNDDSQGSRGNPLVPTARRTAR